MDGFAAQILAFALGGLITSALSIAALSFIIRWRRDGETVVGEVDMRRARRVVWGTLIALGGVLVVLLAVFAMPVLFRVAMLNATILER